MMSKATEPNADSTDSKLRYDWAVLRLVPRVHREEFVNVGVLLHVPTERQLLCSLMDTSAIVKKCRGLLDVELDVNLARQLAGVHAVCHGEQDHGPVAALSSSERFHWLTAPRSAMLQPSTVRIGLTDDPETTLQKLFAEQCG